jgi:hypothetical protein
MSDVPPKKDAFAILMSNATPVCPPDDPWYTAVLYEAWLEHVDPEEPLWRVSYFGQVVRGGTAHENFEARKRAHETDTIINPKDLGFHAVIGMFGADKIAWRVLSSQPGRRSEVQAWANAEEIRLIKDNGGVLRDMDARLQQTLNLTKGGQWGDPRARWEAIDAKRRRSLTKFQAAMEAYVAEHKSALVPNRHVDDDGYKLGMQLHNFRRGQMRKGMSDEDDIDAWAEALPKWAWNATKTTEWRKEKSQHFKDMWKNATEEQRAAWSKTQKDAHNRPEVRAKHVQACTDMWKNATQEERTAWSKAAKDAHKRPEVHAKNVQAGKDRWTNQTEEQYVNRIAKQKATNATDESKAKRSKILKDRHATYRRAELERARPIAVPFEKNNQRRAELRAASTDFLGKVGNSVLYMISKDGKTIRRVQKTGEMGRAQIVGPVVDPPVAEAGPSDLNAAYVSD